MFVNAASHSYTMTVALFWFLLFWLFFPLSFASVFLNIFRLTSSLQGNRCQLTCDLGSYYNGHRKTCEACHPACATCAGMSKCHAFCTTDVIFFIVFDGFFFRFFIIWFLQPPRLSVCFPGTGIEACTKCAEGYLLEDWRCMSTCSSGYYLSEQTSDGGQVQRSCRKWVFVLFMWRSPQPRWKEAHVWLRVPCNLSGSNPPPTVWQVRPQLLRVSGARWKKLQQLRERIQPGGWSLCGQHHLQRWWVVNFLISVLCVCVWFRVVLCKICDKWWQKPALRCSFYRLTHSQNCSGWLKLKPQPDVLSSPLEFFCIF